MPQEFNADGPVGDLPASSLPRGVAVPADEPSSGDKRLRDHEYVIGFGGFGVVTKDLRNGIPVARKSARPDLPRDLASRALEAEAFVYSKLVHPNIVRLLDVAHAASPGEARPLVMELMSEDLRLLLNRREGPLSHHETRHVFVGVTRSLLYMHRLGLAHQDVKCVCAPYPGVDAILRCHTIPCPRSRLENVMVNSAFGVKLGDFGNTRSIHPLPSSTAASKVALSKHYIPPELLRDSATPPSPKADSWALGTLAFVLLAYDLVDDGVWDAGAKAFRGFDIPAERLPSAPDGASTEDAQLAADLREAITTLRTVNVSKRPSLEQFAKTDAMQRLLAGCPCTDACVCLAPHEVWRPGPTA